MPTIGSVESVHLEVRITCGSVDEAERIADTLIGERLAACVHQAPVVSVYVWQGTVEHDEEVLLSAITRADRFSTLAARVQAMHSYELPAITAVAMTATPEYLAWVDATVGDDRR